MRRLFFLTPYIWGVFFNILCISCVRRDVDLVETKSAVLQYNYFAVAAVDGGSEKVVVAYSKSNAQGYNIVVEDTLLTPFLIGGHDVVITYDSLVHSAKGEYLRSKRVVKHSYLPAGGAYLHLKNLSSKRLEYCIIGSQSLEFDRKDDKDFSNKGKYDPDFVIKQTPSPIYRMGPVLYLLKPELSPNAVCYVPWSKGYYKGGGLYLSEYFAKELSLTSDRNGELELNTHFTVEQIISIYRKEYSGETQEMFYEYEYANEMEIGVPGVAVKDMGEKNNSARLYGIIEPYQALSNTGQLWTLNTILGYIYVDEF